MAYARVGLGISPFTALLPVLRAVGTAGIGAGATLWGAGSLTNALREKKAPTVIEGLTSGIVTPLIFLGVGLLVYKFVLSGSNKED
mgnify:CR=1 FL=1